jgi:hypothetical protein
METKSQEDLILITTLVMQIPDKDFNRAKYETTFGGNYLICLL